MEICQICRQTIDRETLVLPIRRANDCLSTISCLRCAEKTGAYCKKHDVAHFGYADGTTACHECADQYFERYKLKAEDILKRIEVGTTRHAFGRLIGQSLLHSATEEPVSHAALRHIIITALRQNLSVSEVIGDINRYSIIPLFLAT